MLEGETRPLMVKIRMLNLDKDFSGMNHECLDAITEYLIHWRLLAIPYNLSLLCGTSASPTVTSYHLVSIPCGSCTSMVEK